MIVKIKQFIHIHIRKEQKNVSAALFAAQIPLFPDVFVVDLPIVMK